MKTGKLGLSLLSASVLMALMPVAQAARGLDPIGSIQEQAKIERAKADLQSLSAALRMYKLNAGLFPTEKQGLAALVARPEVAPIPRRWAQLIPKLPKDPWGNGYRYFIRKKEGKIELVIAAGEPQESIELILDQREEPIE